MPLRPTLSRRALLALGGSTLAACSAPQAVPFRSESRADAGAFRHGVASGDPRADSVVLWTRVTPEGEGAVDVVCRVATRADFSDARTVELTASPARDWCVKLVADGLRPGTLYHYRFETSSATSRTGQTRTLPQGEVERARFAVVSCSNLEHGYFHAYDLIARRHREAPFDALLHLGDYYYEYGRGDYSAADDTPDEDPIDAVVRDGEPVPGMPPPRREHVPAHEILTLADYRTRHAQYRSDPDLQAVTALMPLVAVWDDHETSNDSWRNGAENHQSDEGPWSARRAAALRAYYDWMPVREPTDPTHLWRSFEWGDLLTLVAVETRLTARTEPLVVEDYSERITGGDADGWFRDVLYDPSREMFGANQQSFIVDRLARSKQAGKPWRVLANQVIMARVMTPDMTPHVTEAAIEAIRPDWPKVDEFVALSKFRVPFYPDSWDGYPAARERFFAALDGAGVRDTVVFTGDAHEFWANRLSRDDGTPMGAEFVTTSVSSKTLKSYLGDATEDFTLLMTRDNSDPRYYSALHNGYTEATFTPRRARVQMWAIPDVTRRSYEAFPLARFTIRPTRDGSVKITSPRGLSLKQRLLFSGLG